MKRCISCIVMATVLPALALAVPIAPTGTLNSQFKSFSGTTSGVDVDLGSGPVPTGLISFTLDTSAGADNFQDINWDTGAVSIRLNLLVTFPLLTSLGLEPVPIQVNESGTLDSIPLVELGTEVSLLLSSSMAGGGTVATGTFAGFAYNNEWNVTINLNVNTGLVIPVTVQTGGGNTNSTHVGTITQPGKPPQSTIGSGSGTTEIPEPVSCATLGSGLLAFVVMGCKLRRRFSVRSRGHSG